RSLEHFHAGSSLPGGQRFPLPFLHAFALVKKASALANAELGRLPAELAALITRACDEILQGRHDSQFPLVLWQTGSGTQTNMNLNEVIANRANELAGQQRGTKAPVHPNDHVNLSQSSNDVFPTVMHVVITTALRDRLLPALGMLEATLADKARDFAPLTKTGRTHMMDATPLSLGDEFGAYRQQIVQATARIHDILPEVQALAIGGSAVGTGVNTPPGWSETVTRHISTLSGFEFSSAGNKFVAL